LRDAQTCVSGLELSPSVVFSDELQSALGWDGHLLLLHQTEPERHVELAAWVRRGLQRDEKVLYTQLDDEPPARSILTLLANQGINISDAIRRKQFELLPIGEFYPPGGQQKLIESALTDGYRAVRVSAEAAAALSILPKAVHNDIERKMDEICRTYPVSALCQYDRAMLTDDRLREVVSTHVSGVRTSHMHMGTQADVLVLAGELDAATSDLVAEVLRAAGTQAQAVLRLDLTRVTFLSVVAARALVEGTQAFRDSGGRVLLLDPPSDIEWYIRALGVDQPVRIELVGRAEP
jgi:anti-anti-sigma factor